MTTIAEPVRADAAFGTDLYLKLAGPGSLVFSPASIAAALRMALVGARGDTATELAAALDHQGLTASIVLAATLMVIAAGVFLPPPLARSALIVALVAAAFIWVAGEAFGQILTGGATDPNSAPLLALLALAYWPAATAAGQADGNDGRADGKPA